MDFSNFKVRKVDGVRKIVAIMTINSELGNNFVLEVVFYKKQGGEYRKMPFKFLPKPFCDLVSGTEEMSFYEEVLDASDLPRKPNFCPIPKVTFSINWVLTLNEKFKFLQGKYKLNGYKPSLKQFPAVIVPSGDYMAEGIWRKGDEVALHLQAFASIIHI